MIDTLLPYLFSALVPLTLAAIATAFTSTKRLREELSSEVSILKDMPQGPAQRELRAEIRKRASRLVALTRYPAVTTYDALLAGLFAVVLGIGVWGASEIPDLVEAGEIAAIAVNPIFALALSIAPLSAIYRSWSGRGSDRLIYTQEHMGDDAAEAAARVMNYPNISFFIAFIVTPFVALVPSVSKMAKAYDWDPGVLTMIYTVTLLVGFAVAYRVVMKSKLTNYLAYWAPLPMIHDSLTFPRPTEFSAPTTS